MATTGKKGKKEPKDVSKTSRWKVAEFQHTAAFVDSRFPFAGEDLSPDRLDETMVEILEACPEFYPAFFQRGIHALAKGKEDTAIEFFDAGFKLMLDIVKEKELEQTVDLLIDALEDRLRFDLCLKYLKTLCRLHPNTASFMDGMAASIVKMGESDLLQEAMRLEKRAIELDPRNHFFHCNLGWIHLCAGNLAEAEAALARSLALKADDSVTNGNMAVLRYLKENGGGTLPDYLLRPVEYGELRKLEDQEEFRELDALVTDYNTCRMEAFKMLLLKEGKHSPYQVHDFSMTLQAFFGFLADIMQDAFLYDDLESIHGRFKPIMHKFILKHGDVDAKVMNDLNRSLAAFYHFLSRNKLLDSREYAEFMTDARRLKPELLDKMRRYNKIRHDETMSEKKKQELREDLFDGDDFWPHL